MNLAFISEAGGGKDFLAEYAIKKYGFTRYAFADHVKNVAKVWFPHLYGDGTSKNRQLLQAIGTKFREIDAEVWIKKMFQDIDAEADMRRKLKYSKEFIVVTDCRMPNEYQALKDKGFTFIRVQTDEAVRQARMIGRGDTFSNKDMKHHTETFYDQFKCDYTISNNGTVEEAYESLDRIIDELLDKKVTA
ncbi:hypothetical protein [Bacillus sp. FJAT-22090]|uniref:deoxynucleotide monophosphate kinase family protein n=1 Tax=Bacillus sp. FJAT-22090 TaxID=1581038 RepID=UPI00119E527D|nr:hypothetical protein [Bacillus sp. FJAT-22090]